ncbi:MAG: PAS domain S-box protein [Methanomicrobiaceae archaeon]|nr:PAS domain S-box protein [Methanomicrobiaceae archaeon]
MQGDEETIARILNSLKFRPKGMTITDISRQLNINRNSIAKYLQILLISGQVGVQVLGNAKVYTISDRIPISSMLSCSSDFIVVLDEDARIIHVNGGYLDFTGRESSDLINRKVTEADLPLLSDPGITEMIEECNAGTGTTREVLFDDGDRTCHFRLKFIPTVFEGGNKGVTAIMEDVTSLKETEEALRKSEERYRTIVEDQTDLICRFLPDGTITFANSAFCRYFSMPREEIVGTVIFSYILEDDRDTVKAQISALTGEQPVCNSEHRVMLPQEGMEWRSSKDIFWHLWTTRLIIHNPIDETPEYQIVGRDITKEKEREGMVKRYYKYMEFLAQTAMNFIDMPPGTDIHKNIGKHLQILVPEALYIAVFSCHDGDPDVTIRFDGGGLIPEQFAGIAGCTPEKMVRELTGKGRNGLLQGELIKLSGGVEHLLDGIVSPSRAKRIKKELDLGGIYMMGLLAGPSLLGGAFFLLPRGSELKDKFVIETYLHQASSALKHFGGGDEPGSGVA